MCSSENKFNNSYALFSMQTNPNPVSCWKTCESQVGLGH